jgi:hypothetical protein
VNWREKFWGKRYQAILVSEEVEAQVGRLAYLLAHGVKEGLVASPYDWPGVHCAGDLVEGTAVVGRWRDRTLETKALRKGLSSDPDQFVVAEHLTLSPLPCWRKLEPAVYRARVASIVEEIEVWGRRREQEAGKPPLGREGVCLQDPHLEPVRLKQTPAPLVHAVAWEVRRALRNAYFAFVAAFRRASRLLRAGVLTVEFPAGAFPPALPVRFAAQSG